MKVNNYIVIKSIGEGNFGKVYLTKKKNEQKLYATKILEKDILLMNPILKRYLINEVAIMKELNDDNIIHLYELFQTKNHFYFIMEYCNGGTLSQLLKDYKLKYGKPFSQEIIQHFMRQIVKGLKYIHSKKIIHRDIKLSNILLDFENIEDKNNFNLLSSKVKIIDFGLATKNKGKSFVGSPLYMDPIILKKYDKAGGYLKLQLYDEKADIWSLGAICYEMLTGETLYNADSLQQLIQKVDKGDYTIPIYIDLSKEIISFLNSMLQYEGKNRLSSEVLYNHSFLIKDVKDFSKPDFGKISYKIQNGILTINTKNNQSIWMLFEDENNNGRNHLIEPLTIQRNFNKSPPKNKIEVKDFKKRNRIVEGYVSPKENRKRIIYQNVEINKNKEEYTKDDWQKYMIGLLNEYMEAKKYFEANNLISQENDANNKYEIIKNIKAQHNLGYTIYLNKLPEPISPEYIYGQSNFDRNNKFKKLINTYIKDKIRLISKINSYQKNNICQIKGEFEKDKRKLDNLDSIIKYFENLFNNEWVPAPDYSKELQNIQFEKITYDNCEFKLKFQIKRNDNKNENICFVMSLKINEKKYLKKDINLINQNKYSEECIWSMDFKDWKNIDNNIENFIFRVESQKNLSIFPFKAKINISCIKKGKGISFNLKVPTSKNDKAIINFNVFPIIPKPNKYLVNQNKEILFIHKIFPPFKGKSKLTSNKPKLYLNSN